MDDNSLPTNPIDDGESQTRIIRIVIVIALLAGCCIAAIGALAFFRPDPVALVGKYFPSATPTASRTPTATATRTATPTPNMTATQKVLDVTATVEAFQATATEVSTNWKVAFSDTFDSNKNKWLLKTSDTEYAKTIYSIKDGKYTWDITTHKGSIGWLRISSKAFTDFYLSAEIKQVSSSGNADYGLVFREDANGNFYYFGITNDGNYFLAYFYDNDWTDLISFTPSTAILPDQSNRLAVIAEGDHFTLFINDQFIAEAQDDKIKTGKNALAVELAPAEAQGVFEFDNVEIRVPK